MFLSDDELKKLIDGIEIEELEDDDFDDDDLDDDDMLDNEYPGVSEEEEEIK